MRIEPINPHAGRVDSGRERSITPAVRPSSRPPVRPLVVDPAHREKLSERRVGISKSFTNQPHPQVQPSAGFAAARPTGGRHGDNHHDNHDNHYTFNFNFYFGNNSYYDGYYPRHHCWAYDGYGVWWYSGSYRYYCPPSRFVFTTTVYRSVYYEHHYYYGLAHYGTRSGYSGTDVLALVDDAWRALESGHYRTARRRFARAARSSPDWGLPKIGYALAAAAAGHERPAERILRQALGRDPYALLEIPWSAELQEVLLDIEDLYSRRTDSQYNADPSEWLMLAAVRIALSDPDGAADAAFAAEAAGDTSKALENLLDLIAGAETD